jgi:CubicO group peptidase (beta-lactamase class C family)
MTNTGTNQLVALTPWMQDYINRGQLAGASALVSRAGNIEYCNAVGFLDASKNNAFRKDTLVRIYSMTKPITTLALLQLVEDKKLSLSQPVSEFLPEFSNCTALVDGATRIDQISICRCPTLFELLTHTSGMTYGFNTGVLAEQYAQEGIHFYPNAGGLRPMIGKLAQQPLAFQPGSSWEYSVGIDVIGAVVEVVSGMTLDRYLKKNIFDPLQMTDTSFSISNEKLDRFADCHTKAPDKLLSPYDNARESIFHQDVHTTFSGGGGLISTMSDYLNFAEYLRTKGEGYETQILRPDLVAQMFQNQIGGDIASKGPSSFAEMPMTGVGFGLGGAVVLDPMLCGMEGNVGDYGWGGIASTYFWIDRQRELTCVFFTQLIPSSSYPLRAELKAIVNQAYSKN